MGEKGRRLSQVNRTTMMTDEPFMWVDVGNALDGPSENLELVEVGS